MDAIAENLKVLKRIDLFFIIMGMLEIFILVFLKSSIFGMIFGLITLIPAYIALAEKNINWNYFVGIWTVVRYNPITWIAMLAFIAGDLFGTSSKKMHVKSPMNWHSILAISLAICFVLLVFASFVFGVILLVKTAKHNNLKKAEMVIAQKQI